MKVYVINKVCSTRMNVSYLIINSLRAEWPFYIRAITRRTFISGRYSSAHTHTMKHCYAKVDHDFIQYCTSLQRDWRWTKCCPWQH